MQDIYLLVKKKHIISYEKIENSVELIYIEGNPEYLYDNDNARSDIKKLIDNLVDTYNLISPAEVNFILINNEDEITAKNISRVISDIMVTEYNLPEYKMAEYNTSEFIKRAMQKLLKDKSLYIDEYGINFDGKNYIVSSGEIIKNDFNLLGYPLSNEELIKNTL